MINKSKSKQINSPQGATYYFKATPNDITQFNEFPLKNKSRLKIITYDCVNSHTYALLFDKGAVDPFIVAVGYDPKNKVWRYGKYFPTKDQAMAYYAKCIK